MIIRKNVCKKCEHEWIPRIDNPIECPACKARKWRKKEDEKTKS